MLSRRSSSSLQALLAAALVLVAATTQVLAKDRTRTQHPGRAAGPGSGRSALAGYVPQGVGRLRAPRQDYEVLGKRVTAPALTYYFPSGRSSTEVATDVLSRYFGQKVVLREVAKPGSYRRVFEHPFDSSKLIKVYDPGLSRLPTKAYAHQIQSEAMIGRLLSQIGFRKAKIDRIPELRRFGIIIQEKATGASLAELAPNGIDPSTPPTAAMRRFVNRLRKLRPFEEALSNLSEFKNPGPIKEHGFVDPFDKRGLVRVGLAPPSRTYGPVDRSGNNLFVDQKLKREPVFIDW